MTRLLTPLAVLAVLAAAPAAPAQTYIGLNPDMMEGSTVRIETVTVEVPGTLAIYDYRGGRVGDLLGTAALHAGANGDVLVRLDREARHDVLAVIYAGDVTTVEDSLFMLKIDITM